MAESIKTWSNTSRARRRELAKSLTNASRTFWLLHTTNYDGIAKEAPDNSIESLDLARF
jgi:hypothetical protein